MDGLLLFWIGLCLTFLVLEAATPSLFFFFSGAIGSCASMISHWLGFDFPVQAGVFLIASVISLIVIKYAIKHLPAFKMQQHQKTNIQALIGKHGTVIEVIKPDKRGYVKIHGESWAAEDIHHEEITIGSRVEVMAVGGAHVKVKKI